MCNSLGSYLLELSVILVSILYQAKNTVKILKVPPALMQPVLEVLLLF